MLAGRHLEQVHEFRAQKRISLSPEVIMRAVQGAQGGRWTRAERVRLLVCLKPRRLYQRPTLHLGAEMTEEVLWLLMTT